MRNMQAIVLIAGLLLPLVAGAQTEQAPTVTNSIAPLPRDLEIQLALSALPQHLRDKATVYVLNPAKGFETAREGSNGFHALVVRTANDALQGAWPLVEFRDDLLIPISFNRAGTKAHMRVLLDIAEMQAKSMAPAELKRTINQRYKDGYYKASELAGISYMLSPILRTYTNPEDPNSVSTMNLPHVMYNAPEISNDDVGGNIMEPPFVMGPWRPGPHEYIIQLLGVTERAVINKEYEEMLGRLCKIRAEWCLPKEKMQH